MPLPSQKPVAIIGIGCRFPGEADSPAAFWKLLCEGIDATTEIPVDRWDADRFYDPERTRTGKCYARRGGFIKGVDLFDAGFFGISPREAARMDPQQRLLLEVAWEALEDAAQPVDRRKPANVGVFIGISNMDYAVVQEMLDDLSSIDTHTATGTALSIAANRISHALNFVGPSISVDTACSSSLVALHLACASLQSRECNMALAGGVNIILNPRVYVAFSRLAMLSPEGRCRFFDAKADGFARAEGAGIVVLKSLELAVADGDPIYAVIRGTGVNQDGHTPGITVPNGESQRTLLQEVYSRAGMDPRQVSYIEAHGTGTVVGDPVEANALSAVLCPGRSDKDVLYIGSLKTNVGHMEPAAGIAGVVKVALMLKHRLIPANLLFEEPNPAIDFDRLRIKIPRALISWPEHRPLVAGIDSFGFGGTNAHAILTAAPESGSSPTARALVSDGRPELFCISAHHQKALADYARACCFQARNGLWKDFSFREICRTAGMRRFHHAHRLSIVAGTREELLERLEPFCKGEVAEGVLTGQVMPEAERRIAFVYSGQGPQWWAMGRELLCREPVFREVIERCDGLLSSYSGWSILAELKADEADSRMGMPAIAQPAIFVLQMALTALWNSWGIHPDAAVGHSVGEVAAACAAGVLSLEDALRVIYHRGRCMQLVPETGRMLAAGLSPAEAERFVAPHDGKVSIAAFNSPESLTLSGDARALEEIEKRLIAEDIFCRFLQVNYAFHSHHMDVVREDLLESLKSIQTQPPSISICSTVSGRPTVDGDFTAEYWWRNVREPVHFSSGISNLIHEGCSVFLEIGPHPVLSGPITECAHRHGKQVITLHSLRRQQPEQAAMLSALGALYRLGAEVRWDRLYPEPGALVPFPKYTWNHESCWHQTEECREFLFGSSSNPLLGRRLPSPVPTWETRISERIIAFLADHRIHGVALLPGTAFLELAFAAAAAFGLEKPVLEGVRLHKAVYLSSESDCILQTQYNPEDNTFAIHSRTERSESSWHLNATGKILQSHFIQPAPADIPALQERLTRHNTGTGYYADMRKYGFDYGPSFQAVSQSFSNDCEILGEITLPASVLCDLERYQFHPAALDACIQMLIPAASLTPGHTILPVAFKRVRIFGRPRPRMWSHVHSVRSAGPASFVRLRILGDDGTVIADVEDVECRTLRDHTETGEDAEKLLYSLRWVPQLRRGAAARRASPTSLEKLVSELRGLSHDLIDEGLPTAEVCAPYITNALLHLGWEAQPGSTFTTHELAASLGIAPAHVRLFDRYLHILREDGILAAAEGSWRVIHSPETQDTRLQWESTLRKDPDRLSELMLLDRCGHRLPELLRGQVNALEIIFPNGDLSLAEHLYQDSPTTRSYNILVGRAVERMLAQLSPYGGKRILEIGAGSGGTTAHVLPLLPEWGVEYVFSDVSNRFLLNAEQRFRSYPFVEYKLLDIETDPKAQGFADNSFDIILATQVLHATRSLRATLDHVRELLAPGGVLAFVELMRPHRWLELIFALLDGWWKFADPDLRPDSPLLSLTGWKNLLRECGFSEAQEMLLSGDEATRNLALVLARAPSDCRPTDAEPAQQLRMDCDGSWLIFNDRSKSGSQLENLLRLSGGRTILVERGEQFGCTGDGRFTIRPASTDDTSRLLEATLFDKSLPSFKGIIYLWGLDAPLTESLSEKDLGDIIPAECLSVVYLLKDMIAKEVEKAPRLWIVTRGAECHLAGAKHVSVAQAPLWGLGRVIRNEYPRVHCTLVDLGADSAGDQEREIHSLFEEIRSDEREDEVALQGDERYVHRLEKTSLAARWSEGLPINDDNGPGFRIECDPPGVLENLQIRQTERRKPAETELEIEVHAAGLNFLDVMQALNLMPAFADGPLTPGIECSGVVVRVGMGVSSFRPGDRVFAFASGCLASHVTVNENFVSSMPECLSFADAATIPAAFLTAWYSLVHEAKLQKGERVLIHSAAGGVGLAAVQVARHAGATIFATAGTPEKREFLGRLGIDYVLDSRSPAFADQVMELTDGAGIDVVLNSLAGEAIPKGLSTLRNRGRFVEIGKRDMLRNSRIGLQSFINNLSFFFVDLKKLGDEQPLVIRELLRKVREEFSKGHFTPLPFRVFSVSMVHDAFRHMAQAKHIGKIVLLMKDRALNVAPARRAKGMVKADASYLITGGLGGFGLLVAGWLVQNGARHLVLMGRSGAATAEAREALAALESAGAEVVVVQGDVSKEEDVSRVLGEFGRRLPPLRGIIHAAMVLDDCLLPDLTAERLKDVLDPKVKGAWHLHRLTQDVPLDFFFLFSSCSSVMGLAGQSNYASANAFLDALAWHRRSRNQEATAINWGVLGKVGWTARHEKVEARFNSMGALSFDPKTALKLLECFLERKPTQISVLNTDWAILMDKSPAAAASPLFSSIVNRARRGAQSDAAGAAAASLSRVLGALDDAEALKVIEAALRDQIAKVVGTAASELDIDMPLTDLGFDSLMAVELRNWVECDLGVNLRTMEIMRGPTIRQLAAVLLASFRTERQGPVLSASSVPLQ